MISVIVPIYNLETIVSGAIESILQNTFRDFELILVNDGSTDCTQEVLEQYRERDSRVVIVQKENGGVSDARNAGLDIARGEYIAFIDGDDRVAPEYLEKLCQYAEEHDLDWVESSTRIVSKTGHAFQHLYRENKVFSGDKIRSEVINHSFFTDDEDISRHSTSAWGSLYRRETIGSLRFDTSVRYGEDIVFNYEFAHHVRRYGYLREAMYNYQTYNSMTSGFRPYFISEIFHVFQKLEEIRVRHGDPLSREELIFVFNHTMNIYVHHIFVKKSKAERKADYRTVRELYRQDGYRRLWEGIRPAIFPVRSYKLMSFCFKRGWDELLYLAWRLKHCRDT